MAGEQVERSSKAASGRHAPGTPPGDGEDERFRAGRRALPMPMADQRRQGLLGDLFGSRRVPRSSGAVAKESGRQVRDGRVKGHGLKVPEAARV